MFWLLIATQAIVFEAREPTAVRERSTVATIECFNSHIVKFEYASGWSRGERGRVVSVSLNGNEVPGAAEYLAKQAADRKIMHMVVTNCGMDNEKPVISAVMGTHLQLSKLANADPQVFFSFDKNGIVSE